MVTCPNCRASLPDWAQKCQFCGTDVAKAARQVDPASLKRQKSLETPRWVNASYVAISVWFIVSAILIAGATIFQLGAASHQSSPFGKVNAFSYMGLVFCAIQAFIGLGLIFRVELARTVVNFFCALQIIYGVLGALSAIAWIIASPSIAIAFLVYHAASIAAAGFMIYLIVEMDAGTDA